MNTKTCSIFILILISNGFLHLRSEIARASRPRPTATQNTHPPISPIITPLPRDAEFRHVDLKGNLNVEGNTVVENLTAQALTVEEVTVQNLTVQAKTIIEGNLILTGTIVAPQSIPAIEHVLIVKKHVV